MLSATINSMFIAQEIADSDSVTQIIELWHALVAVAAPFLIGLITNKETREKIKRGLPTATALGVTLITKFLTNTDAGLEIVLLFPAVWGAVLGGYEGFNAVLTAVTRSEGKSINDLLAPARKLVG